MLFAWLGHTTFFLVLYPHCFDRLVELRCIGQIQTILQSINLRRRKDSSSLKRHGFKLANRSNLSGRPNSLGDGLGLVHSFGLSMALWFLFRLLSCFLFGFMLLQPCPNFLFIVSSVSHRMILDWTFLVAPANVAVEYKEELTVFNGSLDHPSIYSGYPNPDLDAAWLVIAEESSN